MRVRTRLPVAALVVIAAVVAGAGPATAQSGLEDPLQCVAFDAADNAAQQLADLRGRLLPLLAGKPTAQQLFDAYLTPGVATSARTEVTDPAALQEFAVAPPTVAAARAVLTELRTQLKDAPPSLRRPKQPAHGTLDRHLDIAYPLGFDTPGLIAGGTGSVESAAGTFNDDRILTATYQLRPRATARGVLKGVRLVLARASLEVLDSIDFCPGGLGGDAGKLLGTLTMSRLERTPAPAGGTYAKPILFRVKTPLAELSVSASALYPGNDPDKDGVPNRQPWRRAGFTLDNCASVRNPGQRDRDRDGRGDACDAHTGPVPRAAEVLGRLDALPLGCWWLVRGRPGCW